MALARARVKATVSAAKVAWRIRRACCGSMVTGSCSRYQAVEKLPTLPLLIKERGVKNGLACEPSPLLTRFARPAGQPTAVTPLRLVLAASPTFFSGLLSGLTERARPGVSRVRFKRPAAVRRPPVARRWRCCGSAAGRRAEIGRAHV